jgi:hypothetical protein
MGKRLKKKELDMTTDDIENSSSGHKLGQLVGDWFQDSFVMPLLKDVASTLNLYLDHRNAIRAPSVRGSKLLWADEEANHVDYDFVMELGGSDQTRGVPVAFFECFWRRGSRHSKDKARDDSGKLMPMRTTYPTARFLGIVASGDFTRPAMELIESRRITLFYVPKVKIIETFLSFGMVMDYDDRAKEEVKAEIARAFGSALTLELRDKAARQLRSNLGVAAVQGYVASVRAALSAAPLEFRIFAQMRSVPVVFKSIALVSEFLANKEPAFEFGRNAEHYTYQVTYSDGTEFVRETLTIEELRTLHEMISALSAHMEHVR